MMKNCFSKSINRALAAKKNYKSKSWIVLLASAVIMGAILFGVCSCKAWRTVTTTSSYTTAEGDKSQTVTIQTKTVEDYQGKKK